MSERKLYLDRAPGETRGVATVDGKPERLLIERPGAGAARAGAQFNARVRQVDRQSGLIFLDLNEQEDAVLRAKADQPAPTHGTLLHIEITGEARRGKSAVARYLGKGEGAAGLVLPAPDLAARLQAFAPKAVIVEGRAARDAADAAEAEALAVEYPLQTGGWIAVEPTRALIAVDVDLGAGGAGVAPDRKRATRQVNMAALPEIARLLRLKGLGGLVVIDLVGRGHDGQALGHAAKVAFAPDQPGVVIGPITRFGTLELSLSQRDQPIAEILCGPDGRPTAETLARRLARAIEREARADPGGQVAARCHPEVAAASEGPCEALAAQIGRRFAVTADPGLEMTRFVVSPAR